MFLKNVESIFKGDNLTLKQQFANSIALTDEGLEVFFDQLSKRDYLSDSIVIITGDHGYPLGNHGVTTTEEGIYEESYRVPFLMVWPGKLNPRSIPPQEGVFSHVDLAPTLIDLLRLNVKSHHFIGQSIFSKEQNKPTFLVQPYSGIHLQIIQYPHKYRRHLALNKEWVYHLEKDPLETRNIVKHMSKQQLAKFRDSTLQILFNQAVIDSNQVYR